MMKKPFLALLIVISSFSSLYAVKGPKWLSDAAFYQIYPSSYMDSDGNGIGDIPGITSRLDYIKSLGINALWLNPVFVSGWFDGGYDVIDFYKVDPRFGTNTDLVNLINEAHSRGMKVCLDLVAGHTSDKCEWFKQSSEADRNQRYSDYYIWADSISQFEQDKIALRHKSPNPELCTIGHYVEANAPRARYYEKNYFECQPALNYGFAKPDPNHPWEQSVDAPGPQATIRELLSIMSFWFDKGVDGFRVDMAHSLVKNDPGKVETIKLWKNIREWKDKNYPECVLISEWANPYEAIPAGFNIDFFIHFGLGGYCSLFFDKGTPFGNRNKYTESYFDNDGKGSIREFAENFPSVYQSTKNDGYIAIPSANHDFQRPNIGTRNTIDQLKVTMMFFLTMPGIPFIYYGDEIGMKFPMGLPSKEGSDDRSGSRTPMQWRNDSSAGFSTCSPSHLYLPVDTDNGNLTVEAQETDPQSLLNFTRKLLSLRHATPALNNEGDYMLLNNDKQNYPMVYARFLGNERYVIALNPTAKKVSITIPTQGTDKAKVIISSGRGTYKAGPVHDTITLSPTSAILFKIRTTK